MYQRASRRNVTANPDRLEVSMASAITRWHPFAARKVGHPFDELEEMRRRMERMFDELGNGGRARQWSLAIDLIERDDKYVLRANVPGVNPDEVKVEVEDGMLTVSAEHEESEEEKRDKFVRRERHYGSFSRSLPLPTGVTADDVQATCKDGVLEVTFPKPKGEEHKHVTITPKAA
jgi:HSP20 family protein